MKGQRLFVRPIDPSDREPLAAFLGQFDAGRDVPQTGLVGKLVGDLAAVLAMELTDDGIRIDDLIVAPELRRKRVGRVMIDELAELAKKMDRYALIVEAPRDAAGFFRKVGFEDEGSRMVRRVR